MEIAWRRELNPEEIKHIQVCGACSEIEKRLENLNRLFAEESVPEIPDGFADQVGTRIDNYLEKASVSTPLSLINLAYSRVVQWALVGVGMVFGLIKIMKFFSGGMI